MPPNGWPCELDLSNEYHDIYLATTILNKSCKTVFGKDYALSIVLTPQRFSARINPALLTMFFLVYTLLFQFFFVEPILQMG
jgi:hypothetical protein